MTIFPIAPIVSVQNIEEESINLSETETALKSLEKSAYEHQESIKELRLINETKNQTISSLKKLNDELLNELKRLKAKERISNDSKIMDLTPNLEMKLSI